MEAQLIEEQELLEYECADGSQVIITTTGEAFSFTDCDISTLQHGTQVFEVFHGAEGTNGIDGNIFIQTQPEFIGNDSEVIATNSVIKEQPTAEMGSEDEYHKCDQCLVRFVSKKALKLHKTVHVDEAFYACEFCPATKIHWTEVWQHQCSNTDIAPIVCPQCHKNVSTKKQLQVHEEVHELQRRFTSKRMEGYFKRKLQDAEDPEVDWGAKPFICGTCGKPFNKLYEVEYHEKLHTGERPSPNLCSKCGLTYITRHDLNKHAAMGCTGELSRKTDGPFKRKQQ